MTNTSKRIVSVLLAFMAIFTMCFILTACERKSEESVLPFTVGDNNELGCVELSRDGVTYRPFGVIGGKSSMLGKKIGVRGDDSSSPIYEVKGFASNEWIIESEEGFMTVGDMLYKAVGVQEIPQELSKYKGYDF